MISLTLPSWHTGSISLPVQLARTSPRYKRTQGLGTFLENPLRFSSMLVKLQNRSQQETSEHSYQSTAAILLVCLSILLPGVIGIIVRLELGTNWAASWRALPISLKGHVSDKMAASYLYYAYERLMPSPWQILCLITMGFAQIHQNRSWEKNNVSHV